MFLRSKIVNTLIRKMNYLKSVQYKSEEEAAYASGFYDCCMWLLTLLCSKEG